ncbi:MAG: hypothetical protein KIT17_03840 [Rubrivivax sp.]|nr:hypothetical protein [Rubrivivax sp.]
MSADTHARPVFVAVSLASARALAAQGFWSMTAREPRGELAALLAGPPLPAVPGGDGRVAYECTPPQAKALHAWVDALRRALAAQGATHRDRAALAQWARRLREAMGEKSAGLPPAPPPVWVTGTVPAEKWTADRYAAHCMTSLRELVDFSQGEAWAEGDGPWQQHGATA